MKIAVYTSCALNYYAKARSLADSIARNSPDTVVALVLCDVMPKDFDPLNEGFAHFWTPSDLGYDEGWIFEHNIMELCTGVNGRALQRLMRDEPDCDLYVYLDPDVYVYNPLSLVMEYMGDASIGLVPHILKTEETEAGVRLTEMSVTEHGIYNLGHLFVRPDDNGRALAAWWAARLDKYCFDDKQIGLFTDQRWMDLVPATFDNVKVLRVPNLDVASWNVFGRRIWQKTPGDETAFMVDDYPLITYHFSGTGPTGTHRRIRDIFDPSNGALAEIERLYEASIGGNGQAMLERIAPAYDFFDDGRPVVASMRKLYRRQPDLQAQFPNPYRISGKGFRGWYQNNRAEAADYLHLDKVRIRRAFDELFDEKHYLATYPDVREAIAAGDYDSALDHYVRIGSDLLYNPHPEFNAEHYWDGAKYLDAYRRRNPTRSVETTLLWHYLETGLPNRIEPVEGFDTVTYLKARPALRKRFRKGDLSVPLVHYFAVGLSKQRQAEDAADDEAANEHGGTKAKVAAKVADAAPAPVVPAAPAPAAAKPAAAVAKRSLARRALGKVKRTLKNISQGK
jgi:hypothetical protein